MYLMEFIRHRDHKSNKPGDIMIDVTAATVPVRTVCNETEFTGKSTMV